jgi:hypothetical protein
VEARDIGWQHYDQPRLKGAPGGKSPRKWRWQNPLSGPPPNVGKQRVSYQCRHRCRSRHPPPIPQEQGRALESVAPGGHPGSACGMGDGTGDVSESTGYGVTMESMERSTIIYALTDPDTSEVRYVGQSRNLRQRYATHLAGRNPPSICVGTWLQSLAHHKTIPSIQILEEVSSDEVANRERWGILHPAINDTLT